MRRALAVAALVLAAAVPAAAAPPGWGASVTGTGVLGAAGTGPATGDVTSGSCSYSGTAVSATGWTQSASAKWLTVDLQCLVLLNGAWYGTWAYDSEGPATQAYASSSDASVPAGVKPTQICITLKSSWNGTTFQHSRCIAPGAYGTVDRVEVAIPFEQG